MSSFISRVGITLSILVIISISLSALPVVTFEAGSAPGFNPTTSGGSIAINNQFAASHGVTFSGTGADPILIIKGGTSGTIAFCGPTCNNTSNFVNLSTFMLMANSNSLTINYLSPVAQSLGSIIDIETTENATFTAFDASNNVLASQTINSSTPGAGEGSSVQWDLNTGINNIVRVEVTGNLGGHAFDDIVGLEATVPEPSSLALLFLGIFALGGRRFLKK